MKPSKDEWNWARDKRKEPIEEADDGKCWHRPDDPKGCWRVRCHLGGKCIAEPQPSGDA